MWSRQKDPSSMADNDAGLASWIYREATAPHNSILVVALATTGAIYVSYVVDRVSILSRRRMSFRLLT